MIGFFQYMVNMINYKFLYKTNSLYIVNPTKERYQKLFYEKDINRFFELNVLLKMPNVTKSPPLQMCVRFGKHFN